MKTKFEELYADHTGKLSDKWMLYLKEWDNIFSSFKEREIYLLEIGIQNGGSLEIWAKYFTKAKNIIGCDINENCQILEFDDERINIIIGDANSDQIENQITDITSGFDIIIDDGSHKSDDIIKTFSRYYDKLNPRGVYLIEDLHASYWKNFNGGLHNPCSAVSFLKRLIDIINFQHWRNNQSRVEYLSQYIKKYKLGLEKLDLCTISSIEFCNSLCVITKQSPEENRLGKRIVVGTEENVTENYKKLNGTSIYDIKATVEADANLDVFSLIDQIKKLEVEQRRLEQKLKEIDNLRKQVHKLEEEVINYTTSKSWKFTRPFRKLMKLIKN